MCSKIWGECLFSGHCLHLLVLQFTFVGQWHRPRGGVVDHRTMIEQYFAEWIRPNGLHAPRLHEAAMWLDFAERHRAEGDHNSARELIGRAIKTHPSEPELRSVEDGYAEDQEIRWFKILCPRRNSL